MNRILSQTVLALLCVASIATAGPYFEDFNVDGVGQGTLFNGAVIDGGKLSGTIAPDAFVLDGSHTGETATIRYQGTGQDWAELAYAIGSSGGDSYNTGGLTRDGIIISWLPTRNWFYIKYNDQDTGAWSTVFLDQSVLLPNGYDPAGQYDFTVTDNINTVDMRVEQVGDPTNFVEMLGIDITTITNGANVDQPAVRFGDKAVLFAMEYYTSGPPYESGIDWIQIGGGVEPVASIDEGDGVVVTEAAGPAHSDTYVINILEAPPANNDVDGVEGVSLSIEFDSNEVCIDPNLASNPVVFTAANWQTPVTITVTAKDDPNAQGDRTTDIVHSLTVLDPDDIIDPNSGYNDPGPLFESDTVTATVIDDEQRYEIVIDAGDGLAVSEQGPTADIYTAVLLRDPTITVNVDIATDGQTTTNPTSLSFDNGNWNMPQTVTVTAVDDGVGETDPHNSSITHAVRLSIGSWNSLFLDSFDGGGVWADLIPGAPNTSEAGGAMTVPGSTWAVSPTNAPAGVYRARARFSFLGTLFEQGEMFIRGTGVTGAYQGRQPGLRIGYWNGGGEFNSLSIYEVDNLGNPWTQLTFDGGPVPEFDVNKDYDLVVTDLGALVTATLTEVGNPANTTTATLANASGFGYGNAIALGASEDIGDTISFEEFEIEEPAVAISQEELNWAGAPIVSDPTATVADNDCTAERATLLGDLDDDCDGDLVDFALLALDFMTCTLPNVPGCI